MKSELENSMKSIFSSDKKISFHNVTPKKTLVLSTLFSKLLRAADSVLLFGDIGSGKSFFARGVIQNMMINQNIRVQEVPSPTFTIVQTYDLLLPSVWHIDLYRVLDADEIFELDLEDGFETGICLIEWPGKLGDRIPKRNISITFESAELNQDMRTVTVEFNGVVWNYALDAVKKRVSE